MKFQKLSDNTAIALSFMCAAHCLVLPLLLILIPSIFITQLVQNEIFHQLMIFSAIVISPFALYIGYFNHKNYTPALFSSVGLLFLVIAVSVSHQILGEYGEVVFTLFGSSILIYGHMKNQLLRKKQCATCG